MSSVSPNEKLTKYATITLKTQKSIKFFENKKSVKVRNIATKEVKIIIRCMSNQQTARLSLIVLSGLTTEITKNSVKN